MWNLQKNGQRTKIIDKLRSLLFLWVSVYCCFESHQIKTIRRYIWCCLDVNAGYAHFIIDFWNISLSNNKKCARMFAIRKSEKQIFSHLNCGGCEEEKTWRVTNCPIATEILIEQTDKMKIVFFFVVQPFDSHNLLWIVILCPCTLRVCVRVCLSLSLYKFYSKACDSSQFCCIHKCVVHFYNIKHKHTVCYRRCGVFRVKNWLQSHSLSMSTLNRS